MKDKIMTILIAVVILEVLLLTLGSVFAMLGMMGFNTGCVYRYDLENGSTTASDTFSRNMSIRADANYSANVGTVDDVKTIVRDSGSYGKWKRANLTLAANQIVNIEIDGIVSLCTSYLPVNNIGSNQNVRSNGTPISIPRVEDSLTPPVTLIFDARIKDWRNILELYTGDIVEVILKDNRSSSSILATGSINNIIEPNIFTGQSIVGDCSEGKQSYSPVCGRWSMWNGGQSYVSSCTTYYGPAPICGKRCCHKWGGSCWDWASNGSPCYNSCWANTVTSGSLPVPYKEDNSLNIPNIADITTVEKQKCESVACNANAASCINACVADPECNSECDVTTCQGECASCGTAYDSCMAVCDINDSGCTTQCANAKATCLDGSADVASCKTDCASNGPVCLQNCQSASIDTCKLNCQSAAICNNAQCSANDTQTKACKALKNDGSIFNNNIKAYNYWFSARDAGGLRQRLNATNSTAGTDSDGILAEIQNPILDFSPDQYTGRKLYSAQYSNNADTAVKYLQYKFYGADHTNYTGGYVFQVKHTKCRRVKGEVISDSYANRGQILYVVSNKDPNVDKTIEGKSQPIPKPKEGKSTIVAPNIGDLWLKVDNKPIDYKDSSGEYRITLSYNVGRATFSDKVLTPLLTMIKQRVNIAGMEIFQNLICLKKDASGSYVPDRISGSCSNFFNYIRAILTLYIMTYGIMFLAGIVKASYQDVVIRVVKIGLVAGLLSGQTFLWFNDTIFNFVIGFTDQIIANFGGFQNISSVNSADNAAAPFMFLNTIFTKIFFTQTFAVQLMAVMGIGMVGIIYFIIVCAAVIILIIVGLRAVAVYIIAMVATAFLISLTPIFLTFMLFEQTYYLFEGWYKALFRFMMEPVILMIGIIVLTQIFTLYLDNVLSYSACWKCSLSFYLPFTGLLPFPGLENVPLFCIYWFGPWGLDNSGAMGQLGMDLSAMLGLVIIAFTLYGYADLASSIASSLTSAPAGSGSSISTGVSMAQSMGQAALKRVGLDDQTQGKLKQEQVKGRAESRQALGKHEQKIIGKEKKLGIYESDTSKALKRGKANIEAIPGNLKDGARRISDSLGITERDYAKEAEKVLNSPEVQKELAANAQLKAQEAIAQHGQEVERIHALASTNTTQGIGREVQALSTTNTTQRVDGANDWTKIETTPEMQAMMQRYGGTDKKWKDKYDREVASHDFVNDLQNELSDIITSDMENRQKSGEIIDKYISGEKRDLTIDEMTEEVNYNVMYQKKASARINKMSKELLVEARKHVDEYKKSYDVTGDEMHASRFQELEERYKNAQDLYEASEENILHVNNYTATITKKFNDFAGALPNLEDKPVASAEGTTSPERVPSSDMPEEKTTVPRDATKPKDGGETDA